MNKHSILLLATLLGVLSGALGCGGGKTASNSVPVTGSWTFEFILNGTVQSVFKADLVSEAASGNACQMPTSTPVGTVEVEVLDLADCFIADSQSAQGAVTCQGCDPMPQGVVVATTINSIDTAIILMQTDLDNHYFFFAGSGIVSNGSMSGPWVCNSTDCKGWTGTFTASRN